MPAYHVDRSIRINAPVSRVRPAIENFAEWPNWSPWLCMEPEAELDVYGTSGQPGHGYSWNGDLVGSGGMKLVSADANEMKMDLEFIKPFKSTAKVKMEIQSVNESETDVTWNMDGKMPFFLFFMVGMMKTFIGADYARGLKMLKEYVETGEVLSETKIVGIVDVPGMEYVGVDGEGSMTDMSESFADTMCELKELVAEFEPSGQPGAVYRKVDLKKQYCKYTAFVPVESAKNADSAGAIKPCKALKVVHRGSYRNLGNAWSAAMSYQRYKKLKPLKKQYCFELYPSDPETTPEKEIVTEIYVPIRG